MTLNDEIEADVMNVFFKTDDFGQAASLSRGAVTITPIVIIDTQEVKTRDRSDVQISRNWVVLLVPVSQYDFGSGLVEPLTTDQFVIDSRRYKPRKPDGMGQCWEYTDGTSQLFKVFVEEVSY